MKELEYTNGKFEIQESLNFKNLTSKRISKSDYS